MCDNKNNLLHQDGGLTKSDLTTNGYDNHRTPSQYITCISKIQLVVYYQCCVLIGRATTRLYVIAN